MQRLEISVIKSCRNYLMVMERKTHETDKESEYKRTTNEEKFTTVRRTVINGVFCMIRSVKWKREREEEDSVENMVLFAFIYFILFF